MKKLRDYHKNFFLIFYSWALVIISTIVWEVCFHHKGHKGHKGNVVAISQLYHYFNLRQKVPCKQ